jgi:hypothetical protein
MTGTLRTSMLKFPALLIRSGNFWALDMFPPFDTRHRRLVGGGDAAVAASRQDTALFLFHKTAELFCRNLEAT